jgi:hypothetical protein
MVPREQRSLMLGHSVKEGSETTDYYESGDPWALADAALATDCIMTLLTERTEQPLFAVETLLNRDQLAAIGARVMPKVLEKSRKSGGRDRDRTCDPYHVKIASANEAKEYQVVRKSVNGISGTIFRLCPEFLVH